MSKMILSIDLGTTSIKQALVNERGQFAAVSTKEYSLSTANVLYAECSAEVYWQAFTAGLKELLSTAGVCPEEIVSVGISAQGETLFFLDEEGNPLCNAIVWMDNRAGAEADILRRHFGDELCYKTTGQVQFDPCWPASKVLWLKMNRPDLFSKTKKIILIEDWLIYKLTGMLVSEGSLLCSSVYWDINTKKWWPEMLDFLGITEGMLPKIMESGEQVAGILPSVARDLGLPASAMVCTGALDQVAGAIGVGNVREGIFSENIGAALAVCAPTSTLRLDPKRVMPVHYFAIPDTYMYHTFTTGGMALRWFRDVFCDDEISLSKLLACDAYDLISCEVANIPAGCDGLIALPHLSGSMAPDINSDAKGVFFGFTMHHGKSHFARAIMESIGYIIRRNIESLEGLDMSFDEVRSLGGGSKSPVWNQIKADITGKRFVVVSGDKAACLGAAILAGKAIGMFESVQQASEAMVDGKQVYEPNPENRGIYDRNYHQYKKLFADLQDMFSASALG